ncbi:nuclear pore complex protein Nup107 [Microplitis demolitor]|uniref:nuclear pore complex protein Nup107 n=1 Tax=Microplitis demolitor TaxID=69319 RepID=UPI0004CD1822|nr:nuclear pore complex protein Nup107 [Microplitis demolitor]XP_014295367.1 nuclear pore complex protein Nup107 [Microplitis demolitor]
MHPQTSDYSMMNYSVDRSRLRSNLEESDASVYADKSNWSLFEMMEDSASTGLILKSERPWKKVASNLYQEFLEIVQSHSSEPQVFDTISDFIQNCTNALEVMRDMQSKVENTELCEEEINLTNERNTWRLLFCLYQNRLASSHTQMETDTNGNSYVSEADVIANLMSSESQVREYQLIIDWLEKNACDELEFLPKIEHFTDKTVAWENTLHQLQNRQSGITFGSSRPLVTSLDPDAPVREGKPLHDLDKEDDARLEKRMFLEVRCGRLQRAQELAIHCGQPWRAACLLGWQPHHDPNYKNPLVDTKLPIEGNPNRSLWKLNAWYMSQDTRLGPFYRAIYASLCGNINQLLAVSRNWEDALWSHVKVLMDIEVESELRGVVAKNYVSMPDDYWKSKLALEEIFNDLHASKDLSILKQSNSADHLIQKYLILDQVPQLMEIIEEWIDSEDCRPQFLRFLAHLVLFLRQIGKISNDKVGDKVLLAYVKLLIEIGEPTLVAFYTAALPQEEQVNYYALYLERIRDTEMRKRCLSAAEDANLNVEAITKMVVENIRNKNVGDVDKLDSQLVTKITDGDLEKIDALEWMTFYPNQRGEALWQANALIRYFLTCDKIDAARKAFDKIPTDTIGIIMMEQPSLDNTFVDQTMTEEISDHKSSASIREYLCYKAYLDAQEGFQEWFRHFHQGKPIPLDPLPTYATFTEKVAYDHKKAQYQAELESWKATMQRHTKAVKQLLFNVLLFPDGGWLVDRTKTMPPDHLRKHQLAKLRSLCIPKITLLLINVMSEMNEHAECIELGETLALERYQLYKVFPKERMREVYKKICESSLVLMDKKKDAWGYSK